MRVDRNALAVAPLHRQSDDRYWRAQLTRAAPPRAPLRLHVEFIPDEVTFLAQGSGPFVLAYGNATATGAVSNLSQIPETLPVASASVGPAEEFGGQARLIPNRVPLPVMRIALWGVLIVAVLLLAWMAYRLSKESDTTE